MSLAPSPDQAPPSLGYGDYLRFSQLVENRFGLHFPEKRRGDLERGIRQAYAASTCADLDEYYRILRDHESSSVHMERLVNALTISETHFFRDANQFDALRKHVLPKIIEQRRQLRTIRIWSAGCASGEEPYSIAILLRELLPDVDEWAITILGTDANTEALARARQALYSDWAFREDEAKQRRQRYFRQQGNRYALIPQVQRMVTFARLNLAEDAYPSYESNTMFMDLILCRNVTIYFAEQVTRQIVGRLYNALGDGGWLVVGHSEHSLITYRRFQAHNFPGAILYQRSDQPTQLPQGWATSIEPQPPSRVFTPMPVPLHPAMRSSSQNSPPPKANLPEEEDPIEQAQELLHYGHSEEARDLLLKLAAAKPRRATVYALLGQAYANLGYWEEAERWCHQAINTDKLALEAYYTLALVLQHQGRLEPAIAAMKKVVYIDRHHVPGHFGLADLYHTNGQLSRALKSLDNARRLLDGQTEDTLVPGVEGITVGRLKEAVVRQQQRWSAEASG